MTERFPYEDIVNLPPHISRNHPQPTMMERAARFAPFAAIPRRVNLRPSMATWNGYAHNKGKARGCYVHEPLH